MWIEEDNILWLKDQILDHRVDRRGRVLDKHLKGQFSLITALYITTNKVFRKKPEYHLKYDVIFIHGKHILILFILNREPFHNRPLTSILRELTHVVRVPADKLSQGVKILVVQLSQVVPEAAVKEGVVA